MTSSPLSPAEIAQLIHSDLHPGHLSAEELDNLTAQLSDAQLEEVVDRLGHAELARQLPPILLKVMLAAQRITRDTPPEYDNEVDDMICHFDATGISGDPVTPPPSSPEPPATPHHRRTARSAPSTPQSSTAAYIIQSPGKNGIALSWFEAGSLTQGVAGASVKGQKKRGPRKRGGPPPAAYTVFFGGKIGVFTRWADVQVAITGHGLAIHAGFPSLEAAEAALAFARSKGWTGDSQPSAPPSASPLPLPSSYEDNPLSSGTNLLWYAVCRGVAPGVYRSYLECSLNTSGVPGNLCNSFETRVEAEHAMRLAYQNGWVRAIARPVVAPAPVV
ncbi:hypothetical protein B0H15DRAFT_806880 [Mycena belliarum]|uniref:Ribonuclease H1 N-terminal domain-containing protein n=1 Tax=Mycena belliarum TaxID=1033014 RepID=A0AAD6TMR0_9AGAR|nr:hypothetical protein B0H15DRAFT_806880 [Mycena belliae]